MNETKVTSAESLSQEETVNLPGQRWDSRPLPEWFDQDKIGNLSALGPLFCIYKLGAEEYGKY